MLHTMPPRLLAILLLCFLIDLTIANNAWPGDMQRRDTPTTISAAASGSAPTSSSSSSSADTTSQTGPDKEGSSSTGLSESTTSSSSPASTASVTTTSNQVSNSAAATSAVITAVQSGINGNAPKASKIDSSKYNYTLTPDELPLRPKVTPAFGVAGALLVILGLIYCIVGIKQRLLHVSFSAGFLAGLGALVMFLYIMNPPVSNALQGAYLVGCVGTGVLLGAGAMTFPELTEGLGCLVGGFSLSMWLLVLRPGGLFTATSSKVVFIAVLTLTPYLASFSHYTRDYTLIGSISFGGATVVVLGIDCFSRAGLKEFWAYIWNLNGNLFPLGATSYPITRGMKVEIAAIILLTMAGVISQTKLWNMIRERRELRAIERLHDEEALAQEEENVGRRIEHANAADRNQWETIYGDRDPMKPGSARDSGVTDMESRKKGATSTVTSFRPSAENEQIEMANMPPTTVLGSKPSLAGPELVVDPITNHSGPFTVRVSRDVEPAPPVGNTADRNLDRHNQISADASASHGPVDDDVDGNSNIQSSMGRLSDRTVAGDSTEVPDGPVPGAVPEVIPLPFRIPLEHGDDAASHRSSVATVAEDEVQTKHRSKHLSAGSRLMRRISDRSNRSSKEFFAERESSTEDLVGQQGIEDDRASSVAATMDELSDSDNMSVRSSRTKTHNERTDFIEQQDSEIAVDEVEVSKEAESLASQAGPADKTVLATPTKGATSGAKPEDMGAPEVEEMPVEKSAVGVPRSLTSSTDPKATSSPGDEASVEQPTPSIASPSLNSRTPSARSKPASITKDRLPPQQSRVVMSYRTNEWAKHLSNADIPEVEDLKMPGSPVETQSIVETAAPVNVEDLQQTAENAAFYTKPKTRPLSKPMPPSAHANKPEVSAAVAGYTHDGGRSRSGSQQSAASVTRTYRSSSGPIVSHQVAESPIEEEFTQNSNLPSPNVPHAAPNTLMSKRDTMVRSKSNLTAYFPGGINEFGPTSKSASESGSVYNYPSTNTAVLSEEDDNISLSARRKLIRQSSLNQYSQPGPSNAPPGFDSHQPQRMSSTPSPMARQQQLANWRASVQQDLGKTSNQNNARQVIERQRSTLLQERQAEEQRRIEMERRKSQRDSMFDAHMRSGGMLDAHREALRRMQAQANRNAS